MLFKGISCIVLLIQISTASGSIVHCQGEHTTLYCVDPRNRTDETVEINALWKKDSGERVIWKYHGDTKKGDTFKNRTIQLNDNLSLSIDGCDLSDQGLYVFCINGKPSCEVRLLVKDSKQCEEKRSREQSTRSPAYASQEKQATTDEKHQQTETNPPNNYTRWVVYISPFLLLIVFLFMAIYACIPREETSKNDKSGLKLIHEDKQSNYVSA